MFNTWQNDPEAFSGDYDEYRQLMRDLGNEAPTPDLFDLVDMHEEESEWQNPDDPVDEELCLDCEYPDEGYDPFLTDAEADGDALASIGWGTDEDYGYYGEG